MGRKSFCAMDLTCGLLDRHYQYVMFLKITVVENLTDLGPLLKWYQMGMEVLFAEKEVQELHVGIPIEPNAYGYNCDIAGVMDKG